MGQTRTAPGGDVVVRGSATDDSNLVTIREFEAFQQALSREHELQQRVIGEARKTVEVLNEARFVATEKALAIQSQEYGRRLDLLNHEQARLQSDRERFHPRENFDQFYNEFRTWRDSVNTQLSTTAGRAGGSSNTWGAVMGLAGIVIAVLALLSRFIK